MNPSFRLKSLATGNLVTITQSSIDIGRGPFNYVSLDSNEVSTRHAMIRIEGETAIIEDLGSKNGTFVNGMPINQPTSLMHGDVLTLGGEQLMLIAPQREDHATVFSLYAGGAKQVNERFDVDALSADALGGDTVRAVVNKIIQKAIAQSQLNPPAQSGVLVSLANAASGDVLMFDVASSGNIAWKLGRDESLEKNIDHPTVSVNHATISFKGGQWCIADNNSTNGTKINKRRVVQGAIQEGDIISLGKLHFAFGVAPAQ